MIEKKLKTTDGKLSIKIPTHLTEVTLGQMIEMQEKQHLNDLDAISILSGIPVEELNNVRNAEDFYVFENYVLSLSNQIKYLYDSDDIPTKVTFTLGDKKIAVNVIRNLSIEPAGAFMAARDIIADEINEHISLYGEENWKEYFNPSLKACCHVLAHYFYCRVTDKRYNEYEAEEFCESVKQLRVTEALPIAKHFFISYPNLLKQKTNFFQLLHHFWRRRQVSKRLKNLNT
jgi:hypothetical protein